MVYIPSTIPVHVFHNRVLLWSIRSRLDICMVITNGTSINFFMEPYIVCRIGLSTNSKCFSLRFLKLHTWEVTSESKIFYWRESFFLLIDSLIKFPILVILSISIFWTSSCLNLRFFCFLITRNSLDICSICFFVGYDRSIIFFIPPTFRTSLNFLKTNFIFIILEVVFC